LELSRYVVLNPVRANMVEDASQWPWSSYGAMVGMESTPSFLSVEPVLELFSANRGKAKQLFANFVAEGVNRESIWSELKQQIFLGHDDFVSNVQGKAKGLCLDSNIPKAQQLAPAKSLQEIAEIHKERNFAMLAAYQTGVYSYSQIADYFNVHFTTVGRIIRAEKKML